MARAKGALARGHRLFEAASYAEARASFEKAAARFEARLVAARRRREPRLALPWAKVLPFLGLGALAAGVAFYVMRMERSPNQRDPRNRVLEPTPHSRVEPIPPPRATRSAEHRCRRTDRARGGGVPDLCNRRPGYSLETVTLCLVPRRAPQGPTPRAGLVLYARLDDLANASRSRSSYGHRGTKAEIRSRVKVLTPTGRRASGSDADHVDL